MKILLINYSDSGGGAATAALRLTEALNSRGIEAVLGVVEKKTLCPFVQKLPEKRVNWFNSIIKKNLIMKIIKKAIFKIKPKFETTNKIYHSLGNVTNIDVDWINTSDFDVINLHWISDTLSIKDISKITKPIVWTMHDSWPCCGAEHHPNILENDDRWKNGYFSYNKPKTTKGPDICRMVWNKKRKYLADMNISFIAPSKWECDVLKESALFSEKECIVIPNIIPKRIFHDKNKIEIRKNLEIPENKIIIGFGAAYDIDDPKSMKGSYYLLKALERLENPEDYFFLIFGPAGESFTSKISVDFMSTGYINNPILLSCLYNACDCLINPSLIENLPTTCLESIACGVPVVAFDVGGTNDVVLHKKTGYLAKPYDIEEIVKGIYYCTANKVFLQQNCLSYFNEKFNDDDIVNKYKKRYEEIANNA